MIGSVFVKKIFAARRASVLRDILFAVWNSTCVKFYAPAWVQKKVLDNNFFSYTISEKEFKYYTHAPDH